MKKQLVLLSLLCMMFASSAMAVATEAPGKCGGTTAAGHPVEGKLESFLGESKFEMQQVFNGGTPGRRGGGRLPNVVVATDGTVLATHGATGGPGDWWKKGLQGRRSEDGGKTWPIKRRVFDGPSGYSSLTAGRPGTPSEGWIYLQFEGNPNGDRKWRSRPERENGIARFNLSWLLDGEKTGDGEVPKWLSR